MNFNVDNVDMETMTVKLNMGTDMNAKNTTRISSTLGTWTGQTHLKTDIGSYELLAYFVIHFMPDPMRGYGCSLASEGCSELHNQVCEVGSGSGSESGGDSYAKTCTDIAGNVVDWSDVTAFMYFGAHINVGFPFNKNKAEDTEGWVGPFNIIMAKGELPPNDNNNSNDDDTKPTVVDRYVSRYVKSPLTKYLKMPQNCSLLGEDDFQKVAGPAAVDSTAMGQYDPDHNYDNDENYDPYAKYLKTCDNGDVKPLLPLFEFEFEEVKSTDVNGTVTTSEQIQVKVHYKFLTMSNKSDFMYKLWPMVQRRFNNADMGFKIAGPYCYGGDPKRGYTFDMNFDTRDPKAMLKLEHGCVEGLPCTPPAADLYNLQRHGGGGGGGGGYAPDSSGGNIPIPEAGGSTVNVGQMLILMLLIVLLSFILLCSCGLNCRLHRRLKVMTTDEVEEENIYQSLLDDGDDENQSQNDGEIRGNEDGEGGVDEAAAAPQTEKSKETEGDTSPEIV